MGHGPEGEHPQAAEADVEGAAHDALDHGARIVEERQGDAHLDRDPGGAAALDALDVLHRLEHDHTLGAGRTGGAPEPIEGVGRVDADDDRLLGRRQWRLGAEIDGNALLVGPGGDQAGHRPDLARVLDERHLSRTWSELHPSPLLRYEKCPTGHPRTQPRPPAGIHRGEPRGRYLLPASRRRRASVGRPAHPAFIERRRSGLP